MVQRFRDSITELSRRLGELGPSARLLIGSLAIILAMGFFLVSQYAAGPSMSPIKVRIEDKATAISKVRELGYEVEDGGTDVILVDVREKRSITEMLENDGLAPTIDDAAAAALSRELIAYAKQHLADVKCPRSVDFLEELPRHPTGKLYKRLLKDQYWAAAGRSI